MRSKEKVPHIIIAVKPDNFREYREWRVVNNNAITAVVFTLVISVRIERADNSCIWSYAVFFQYPLFYSLVHCWRCVAIVRGLLRFELFNKALVIV